MRCRGWCCAPPACARPGSRTLWCAAFSSSIGRHERGRQSRPLELRQLQRVLYPRAQGSRARHRRRWPRSIACPVDGSISEAGSIDGDALLQAKGRRYSLAELLAGKPWAGRFEGGSFATIYLAPFNYHRVHMPLRGDLEETVYVPGRLFSVNAVTAAHVPRLFARNERVLTLFDTAFGQVALIMVGALNVGSMATVWAGDITPARAARHHHAAAPTRDAGQGRGARTLQHGLDRDPPVPAQSRQRFTRTCARAQASDSVQSLGSLQ